MLLGILWHQPGYAEEQTDVQKGEYIFRATGGCGCHTDYKNNGEFLAGGRGIQTPFGIFYGTNITPDKETGIGRWSDDDFIRAMTKGLSPQGTHYAPVFPYTSFTKMTREDLLYLKAYLFSIPPVKKQNKPHDLIVPFGQQIGFMLWKKIHFRETKFKPNSEKSIQWNRGAYIAETLAHCGECHTPRDWQGVLKEKMRYAGSQDGPEGELAPNITPDDKTGVGDWSTADMVEFLKTGLKPNYDDSQGLMIEVIEEGYSHLKQEDLEAISEYLRSLPPIHNPEASTKGSN
ncbi:MAG: cytochrome c [SAR324 cluster bacterium]|nr:cytochrome c [SAR324 cluster bacterium]